MPFTAKDVMMRASSILQDHGFIRWPLSEIRLYLNDAMREIAMRKPTATAVTVELALQPGTYQVLPDSYHALLAVNRNLVTLDGDPARRGGGRAITLVKASTLDNSMPGWGNAAVLPYHRTVVHLVEDMSDQAAYHVVPGNDGTGIIEAVVSKLPALVPSPANPLDIDAYAAYSCDIKDIYQNTLLDYVLYRCFSKDINVPGAPNRAQAHYQQFAEALGIKRQAELTDNAITRSHTT